MTDAEKHEIEELEREADRAGDEYRRYSELADEAFIRQIEASRKARELRGQHD